MLSYKKFFIVLFCNCIIGCATNSQSYTAVKMKVENKHDPYEKFNRRVYTFNSYLDGYFFRPVTIGYITIIPKPIQVGIENVFTNLRDFVSLGNAILQLRVEDSFSQFMRISINSTIGLFGLFDIAGSMGLSSQKITFGDSMKYYGWKQSAYFVAPLFGPSTVRDFIGTAPNVFLNPTWYIFDNNYISIGLFFTNSIQQRSKLLGYDQLLVTSLDPYITVRDYYLKSTNEDKIESEDNSNDVSIDELIK
jgi:phospholipid-binding lipoprotein MlaA